MFIIGAIKTYHAFNAVFFEITPSETLSHLKPSDIATAYLIKSIDAFLIALVLFIFAYGVYSLFLTKENQKLQNNALSWIKIPNISHLKNILAEVIIIILFVKFLEFVFVSFEQISWEVLYLPASILLLSLGLKFLELRQESK
jgi:uncharacterized membrane protein YqhA